MAIVHDAWPKIKAFADTGLAEWGIFALILIATIGAFALGRLSVLEASKPLISVTEAPQTASIAPLTLGGSVIAAKSGTVYYFPWCTGVTKISPQNRETFASVDDAKKAGFKPAKNCKGLQ